jgi:N-acylneuraminate cytidylyltransferase
VKKLILIPARAGSKGLSGKNTKLFIDKPLISHTIDFAIRVKKDDDIICISSNDDAVISIAKNYQKIIILRRPEKLAGDSVGMNEVLLHAIDSLEVEKKIFKSILLLQPTSPLRSIYDYDALCKIFDKDVELAVSVKEAKSNPYFNLFEETEKGYLEKSKASNYERRQDAPLIYEYNGSMYLAKITALKKYGLHGMKKIRKMVMPEKRSIDIDDENDWQVALSYYNLFKNDESL